MATYKYEARQASGKVEKGTIEADSEQDAVKQLRGSFEAVLSVKKASGSHARQDGPAIKRVKPKELALASRQFAIILKAGLPLVQTVNMAAEQTSDEVLSRLFKQVAEDVDAGWSLSYSFNERAPYLPVTFRETIRAGEESGDLISAFERMSDYYDRMQKTHSKTVTTLSYPAFIIFVAIIVVGVVVGYAVPVFSQIFESMGSELPPLTRALIGASDFLRQWFLVIVGCHCAACVCSVVVFAYPGRCHRSFRAAPAHSRYR